VTAQDEARLANTSIHMARQGEWLTPRFMGRYALCEPPLLYWLSAASARVLGVSTLALRLPVALAAALAAGLVFLWAAELGGWPAGALALALLVSNHLWHVLGGMAMPHGLLAAFSMAALYALFADPWLDTRAALWGFSASVAAAMLTGSVAGILPLAVLGLYWMVAPRRYRPRLARVCLTAALALALAAPWFVYQLAAHGQWFRAEHIEIGILGFGFGAPPQISAENPVLFYAARLALTDPLLLAAALVAIPGLVVAVRRRSAAALLLVCWLAVTVVAVLGWQHRNVAYLLPVVPALVLLAAVYGPLASRTSASAVVAIALAAVVAKAVASGAPWGISFAEGTVQPLAATLRNYCGSGRANELILVGMDDGLYASALPLSRLRYARVGTAPAVGPYSMNFADMGIEVTAGQFDGLAAWLPVFGQRLHAWGLDSTQPVATVIQASSPGELADVIRAHPGSDFLAPDCFRDTADTAHVLVEAFPGHFLLLSRKTQPRRAQPAWTCRM
jgi:hypothetical protein